MYSYVFKCKYIFTGFFAWRWVFLVLLMAYLPLTDRSGVSNDV